MYIHLASQYRKLILFVLIFFFYIIIQDKRYNNAHDNLRSVEPLSAFAQRTMIQGIS